MADSTVWEEGGWGRRAEAADDVLPRETAKFAPLGSDAQCGPGDGRPKDLLVRAGTSFGDRYKDSDAQACKWRLCEWPVLPRRRCSTRLPRCSPAASFARLARRLFRGQCGMHDLLCVIIRGPPLGRCDDLQLPAVTGAAGAGCHDLRLATLNTRSHILYRCPTTCSSM